MTPFNKARILLSNIYANLTYQVWILLLYFIATPYFVRWLGNTQYGIVGLVMAMAGYLWMLDFGISDAAIKYIAEYKGRKDEEGASSFIRTAFLLNILVGGIGAVIIFVLGRFVIIHFSKIPPAYMAIGVTAFYLAGLDLIFKLFFAIFSVIPKALQRFDLFMRRNIFLASLTVILQLAVLKMGGGILGFLSILIFTSLISGVVFYRLSRKLMPSISYQPSLEHFSAGKLLGFVRYRSVSIVFTAASVYLDKVLVGLFLPIATLTFYIIPRALLQNMIVILGHFLTPLYPLISEHAQNLQDLQQIYVRAVKFMVLFFLPCYLILGLFSRQILLFWMGEEFARNSSQLLCIMSIAYFASTLSAVPALIAEGCGKPRIPAFNMMGIALSFFGLSVLLIPRLGLLGVAFAAVVSEVVFLPLLVYKVNTEVVKIRSALFFRPLLKPLICGIILAVFFLIFRPRLCDIGSFLLCSIGGIPFYLLVCILMKVLDSEERQFLSEYFAHLSSLASRKKAA